MKPKLLDTKIRRCRLNDTTDAEPGRIGLATTTGTLTMPAPPRSLPAETRRKTLLLVSDDAALGARSSNLAGLAELAFLQINNPVNALRLAEQDHPAVVFIDLDLPAAAGWEAAERFLDNADGPPLVLLTGRTEHPDFGMAVRAGMVLDKSASPAQLLEKLDHVLAGSGRDLAHRRAGQQLLIRWLRPYGWTPPAAPAIRHWGINE